MISTVTDVEPVLDFDGRDFTRPSYDLPVPIERMRALALVRLTIVIPLAMAPTAFFLWMRTAVAWHPEGGRAVALLHSGSLAVYLVLSLVLYRLAQSPNRSADRSILVVNGVSIICEALTNAAFLWGTGSLASHSTAFYVAIIAAYAFTLGYWPGLYSMVVVFLTFVVSTLLELGGVVPISPLLDAPIVHPAWMETRYAAMVMVGVTFTMIATFGFANYARNQSNRLHRYITELVLRRYLPEALVARAAEGRLRMDAPPERRVVTVMFTDLVGFTALSERLGPSALGEAINRYLATVADLAHADGATVDKFIGDCVMVVYGTPEPLPAEDQAQRAVALARAIHEAVPGLSTDPPLQARTGINTGEAVAGNFGSRNRSDYTVLGPAVNVAARLESASAPGRILIGPETAALLGEAEPVLEPTEPLHLKGVSAPVIGYFLP